MPKRTVQVLDRQTLVDIAIQEHGSVEGLFLIPKDDATVASITTPITPGQLIKVVSPPVDTTVHDYYAENGLHPVTGRIVVAVEFVCEGPGYGAITMYEEGIIVVITDTGYYTLRRADGTLLIRASEEELMPGAGTYCLWPSNVDGVYTGNVVGGYVDSGVESIGLVGFGASVFWLELYLVGTVLDLSANSGLDNLSVTFPGTVVDITTATELTQAYIDFEGTELDLTHNEQLTTLNVDFNGTSIDLSHNVALMGLWLQFLATEVDLSANVELQALTLVFEGTEVDLTANIDLLSLHIDFQGAELILHEQPELLLLDAKYPGTVLDISANVLLTTLYLEYGGGAPDLTTNVALVSIDAKFTDTSFDLSNQIDLRRLKVVCSSLVDVPLHASVALRTVTIQNASLNQATVDGIINALDPTSVGEVTNISGGTSASPSGASAANMALYLANNTIISN